MGSWSSLHEISVRVKTLMGLERFEVETNYCRRPSETAQTAEFPAEILTASSVWIGDHRSMRILCASKLLWV